MIIILMGVTGCGKTTVGRLLAARLGVTYHEGDAFHAPAAVRKMAAGVPLDDDDRGPWLLAIRDQIDRDLAAQRSAVISCSALKQRYRDVLAAPGVHFVHLKASPGLIRNRLANRTGHYMPASLIDSQFADLEPPADALDVDAALPPETIVERVVSHFGTP